VLTPVASLLACCYYDRTNPLDVIRNSMFQTNEGLVETVRTLYAAEGWGFLHRGMGKNLVAVAIPLACTIFCTDALIQTSQERRRRGMDDGS
jgi:hypothetical protein